MNFEDLQSIWDTQNDRPVFSMNDTRLAVGLYQQRDEARRRVFRQQYAPLYFGGLTLVVVALGIFVAFFFKTLYRMRTTDPQMNVLDGIVLAIAILGMSGLLIAMYLERRKHERAQTVFAPSLREELEHGLTQLEFELTLHSYRRFVPIIGLIFFSMVVVLWEAARLNGLPVRNMLWTNIPLFIFSTWLGVATRNKVLRGLYDRRRALESMLASLKEDVDPRS